eukprot:752288-Hanusia_phi.AAC.5
MPQMLSGPHGSFVTLSFRRKSIDRNRCMHLVPRKSHNADFNSSKDYTVQLTRNANFYPDVIAVPPVEERVVVWCNWAVVEVRVPRRPGAVEGERELLVVLVLLAPHPKGLEHLSTAQDQSVQVNRDG